MPGAYEVNLGGEWKPLNDEEVAFLVDLERKGLKVGEAQARGHTYRFDLNSLTQTNVGSGKVRQLRRKAPTPSPLNDAIVGAGAYGKITTVPATPPPSSTLKSVPQPIARLVEVWLAGEWKKLSAEDCDAIHAQWSKGKDVFEIECRKTPYRFDMKQMTQTNLSSGRTRTIRFSAVGNSVRAAALGFEAYREEFRKIFGGSLMTEANLLSSWPSAGGGDLWHKTATCITKEMGLRGNAAIDMVEWNHYWAMERDSPSFHAGKEVNEKMTQALRKDPQVLGRMQMHFETALDEQARDDEGAAAAGLSSQGLLRVCERLVASPKDVPEKKWAQEVLQKHKEGDGTEDDIELSYYDFLNVMLGRKKFKVSLWMYDISDGIAQRWAWLLLGTPQEGIWHTGVVIEWPERASEFWFGGRIFESPPGVSPFGTPVQKRDLGYTYKLRDEAWNYVARHCAHEFTSDNYDVLTHNCNHFSDKLTMYLHNQHIPDEVRLQPERLMSTVVARALRPLLNRWLGGFDSAADARATDKGSREQLWEQVLVGAIIQFEREEGGRPLVGEVKDAATDSCSVRILEFWTRSDEVRELGKTAVTAILKAAPPGARPDVSSVKAQVQEGAWFPRCTAPAIK